MIDLNALVLAGLIYLKDKEQEKDKMKEFDKKDVFSWSNAEDTKQYIGKEGYFAESISILERDIEQQHTSRLIGVDITEVCCFHARNKGNYSLFLPIDKVKKPEKKWRAFKDLNEFANTLGLVHILGSEITYRTKADDTKGNAIITRECESGKISYISLGSLSLSLENLFKYYEWLDKDGIWRVFGVLENES